MSFYQEIKSGQPFRGPRTLTQAVRLITGSMGIYSFYHVDVDYQEPLATRVGRGCPDEAELVQVGGRESSVIQ
jgi:hypothetical protein